MFGRNPETGAFDRRVQHFFRSPHGLVVHGHLARANLDSLHAVDFFEHVAHSSLRPCGVEIFERKFRVDVFVQTALVQIIGHIKRSPFVRLADAINS